MIIVESPLDWSYPKSTLHSFGIVIHRQIFQIIVIYLSKDFRKHPILQTNVNDLRALFAPIKRNQAWQFLRNFHFFCFIIIFSPSDNDGQQFVQSKCRS